MYYKINNLVFEGGGVLGIAYLGVIEYLYQKHILQNINRVAGTSAGAITACITSFRLSSKEIKEIADSLDFRKIPEQSTHPNLEKIPKFIQRELENIFGDINSLYRLFQDYGWYSSQYFYQWLQQQIANQFDSNKKKPPYTFADFKNPDIHKDKKEFMDLYVIGTNISYRVSQIFSYETTPDMEVAQAVRISMSIPLFFESIKLENHETPHHIQTDVFSDGGIMRNYPINIFDATNVKEQIKYGLHFQTLGARFKSTIRHSEIRSLIDYIKNLNLSLLKVQQDMYLNTPKDIARSIEIETGDISSIDFDIDVNDKTYNFLYRQGYVAAENYFKKRLYR